MPRCMQLGEEVKSQKHWPFVGRAWGRLNSKVECAMPLTCCRRESPRGEESSIAPTANTGEGGDAGVVGTVMVRDVVSRGVVAHWRAHTAPLLALAWDASGTLLVTASVHGHNIHVFQVGASLAPWLWVSLHASGQASGSSTQRP